MNLAEVVLSDNARASGLKIAGLPLRSDYGCTVVRIERQGIVLPKPGPDTILFPNDKLLLLGTEEDLQGAEAWLNNPSEESDLSEQPAELSLGHLIVPRTSRHVGKSLGDLGVRSQFGIQVVGIERGHASVLSPRAEGKSRARRSIIGARHTGAGFGYGGVAFELRAAPITRRKYPKGAKL